MAAMAAGIVWNISCAVADHLARRNQPQSLRTAMRLMPADGAYRAQYADAMYAGDRGEAARALSAAVELNPYDAQSWIQLGLLDEADNNMTGAEGRLLRAAGADQTFVPAWSLANFYFRRQDAPKFWIWAQRAAQMAPGDTGPLFRLAWYVNPSVSEIENRLRIQRPVVQSQFVSFLIAQSEPQAASEAALHLISMGGDTFKPSILSACDWLLATKHPDLAQPLWIGLASRRQIPYPPFAPGTADTVTNGEFAHPPLSLGFDWHLGSVEGVSSFLNTSPNGLGFEFTGNEPEHFNLLHQTALVRPQQTYTLVVDYESDAIPANSGLTWRVTSEPAGAVLAQSGSLFAPDGGQTAVCFTVPGGTAFVGLSLEYQRQSGTVRPQGKLALTRVRLTNATGQSCGNGQS